MNRKILVHFKKSDPILYSCIRNPSRFRIQPSKDYFFDLCEAVIWQQLSDKAASKIVDRFTALFGLNGVTPQRVLKTADEKIRAIGISWSKVRFIKEIAGAFIAKTINPRTLRSMDDEAVIGELTKVKGIGPWTAQMFLMFSLGREDIFSSGDLGLRKAIGRIYKTKKEPTPQEAERIAAKWSPYRTYACLVLWSILDG